MSADCTVVAAVRYILSGYRLWYGIALHLTYDTLAAIGITVGFDRILASRGQYLFP